MARLLNIAGCILFFAAPAFAKGLAVGDKAPPLTIGKWLKGTPVDVTRGGKDDVYIVEFWATWCGPCKQSIPHLSELQNYFKDKKVTFVSISGEDATTVGRFLKQNDKRM